MNKFGNKLKELRKEKGLTQAKLGELLKTSHATINRYENNIYQPDLDTLNKLADIFNVSLDYLLGRTNEREIAIIQGKECIMLGERLKELRKQKGIEAQYIAKIINVSKSTYSYYENDKSEPSYETLIKLADIFNVTTDYLLGRAEYKDGAIIEGNEVPKELRKIGVEYLEVNKSCKEKGLTPDKIKTLIKGFQDAGLIK